MPANAAILPSLTSSNSSRIRPRKSETRTHRSHMCREPDMGNMSATEMDGFLHQRLGADLQPRQGREGNHNGKHAGTRCPVHASCIIGCVATLLERRAGAVDGTALTRSAAARILTWPGTATAGNLVRVAAVVVLVHVETGGGQALEDCSLVAVLDSIVGGAGVVVPVALALVCAGRAVGVIAVDLNLAKRGKVVAMLLDIVAVPIYGAAGPVDRSLGVGVGSTGPDRQLHARWRLREVPLVRRIVPRV